MGKSTISMAIFNSFLYVHQRVTKTFSTSDRTKKHLGGFRKKTKKTNVKQPIFLGFQTQISELKRVLCMRLIALVVLGKYEAKTAFIEEAE